MNPEPATKLTDRLAAETLHGHAPIHSRSVNPGLTVAPLGERIILVTAVLLGEPRKGEIKGGFLKPQREKVTRQTGLVEPCFPELYSSKVPSAHCRALKQDPGRGQRTKSDSMIPMSVTIPNLFPTYAILKLSSSNSIEVVVQKMLLRNGAQTLNP